MKKVALVTGGTRGIGGAISKTLEKVGYEVIANYKSNDEYADKFSKLHRVKVSKWDVRSYEECETATNRIINEYGKIDVVVANAGITRDAPFHKLTQSQWHEVINTNLSGVFNTVHPVWSSMRQNQYGRVIVMSSINGQKGQFGQVNYSASKAALLGFIKSLAQEGARYGITSNAICPGYTSTDMLMSVPENIRNNLISQIPTGRFGEPFEVAKCVEFLASDEAAFINGSTISINGGHFVV